ncbi:carboxypeptidase-like regulatory domain-containing protein [Aquimarina sediminis]|uniref:carboxypeptidase-like regulatory domain-containing protein n=1 Tax=Aquimarina sediminis TaxID=2070536 RepID=UPI000FFE8D91|nr:carboxypeptidase-like regulatory domain-containing protein [Aquimarina sediminis]
MQKILFVVIFLMGYFGISQEGDFLRGKVKIDASKSEVINILNITRREGTINDKAGFFEIKSKVGDTIVFSSIGYQKKAHVVRKKDIKQADLEIVLEVKVNELEEVRVSRYNLSGEVKEDIDRIKTYEDNLPLFDAKELDETPFIHEKGAGTVKNIVLRDEMAITPVNFIAVGRMVASLFKKKGGKRQKKTYSSKLSDFYRGDFFITELKIPKTEVYDFIDFLNDDTMTKEVLESGNELRILEFLIDQSKVFKSKDGLD